MSLSVDYNEACLGEQRFWWLTIELKIPGSHPWTWSGDWGHWVLTMGDGYFYKVRMLFFFMLICSFCFLRHFLHLEREIRDQNLFRPSSVNTIFFHCLILAYVIIL
jgi:hypothetical protein